MSVLPLFVCVRTQLFVVPAEHPVATHPPLPLQVPPVQAVPTVTFAHVPFVPPVNDARQLWQLLPLQAVLQHTPDEQFPLAH